MNSEFLTLAKKRYSCRKFQPTRISDEEINQILVSAQIAPTAKNIQPIRVLLINTDESIEKLKLCTPCSYGCKTAFIICYNINEPFIRSYDGENSGVVDCSIITTHMMLEAADLGIGSTWVMNFNPAIVKEQFNLPEDIIPVAVLVVGYPAEDAKPADRHTLTKELSEIVVEESF